VPARVLWSKIGWAERYQGDPVSGDFDHPEAGRAEQFNFLPDSSGRFLAYVGHHGGASPSSARPDGWTVIFLARKPGVTGMHIVGWYEDAHLLGRYRTRKDASFPPSPDLPASAKLIYNVTSPRGFLVPRAHRSFPYSHPTIGTARFSYLAGPGVETTPAKSEVLKALSSRLKRLRRLVPQPAVRIASPLSADPLLAFGDADHRRIVEEAAVEEVTAYLDGQGYDVTSEEHLNHGWDLRAVHRQTGGTLLVEVKGTASPRRRFFITANELDQRQRPEWRFALVTRARSARELVLLDLAGFEAAFDLKPLVYSGRGPKSDEGN
jgi:hypothetical protein